MQLADLAGRITEVTSRKGGTVDFKVFTLQAKKTYLCVCPFFCPIEPGDFIYARCELAETLRVLEPPLVNVGTDRMTLVQTWSRYLKGALNSQRAGLLHDKLHELAMSRLEFKGANDKVALYLGHLAELWQRKPEPALLGAFADILRPDIMAKLLELWLRKFCKRRLYLLGLNNKDITACRMGLQEIYQTCCRNPYILYTLPLEKCQAIMKRFNREPTLDELKATQIVRHVHKLQEDRGWVGIPTHIMAKLYPHLPEFMDRLKADYQVAAELRTVYLPYAYKVETELAKTFDEMIRRPKRALPANLALPDKLTDDQKEAVKGALRHPISLICGPAGTGKTTVIKALIEANERQDIETATASFTGKAVSRIREVVGRRAPSTLHRMIAHREEVKEFKHLIIDEASMVTEDTLYEFMQAYGYDYQITLIGDPNQLPTIGWGALLLELLKTTTVPTFRLTNNHRFGATPECGIARNAQLVLTGPAEEEDEFDPYEGKAGQLAFVQTPNFRLLPGGVDLVMTILGIFKKQGLGPDAVQIITPYNEDVITLNERAQGLWDLQPDTPRLHKNGRVWRVDDRVLMLENNYAINIFNGETGIVTKVSTDSIDVKFNTDTPHTFLLESKYPRRPGQDEDEFEALRKKELTVSQLTHAYCLTCHKIQGSEAPYVVIYIPPDRKGNASFLTRNLVYTMITRAKTAVYCVGDIDAFCKGALKPMARRVENLAERLNTLQAT